MERGGNERLTEAEKKDGRKVPVILVAGFRFQTHNGRSENHMFS